MTDKPTLGLPSFAREQKNDKTTGDMSNVAHEVQMSCHKSNQLSQWITKRIQNQSGQAMPKLSGDCDQTDTQKCSAFE